MTEARSLPSVLFVTSELVGPFKNGGLGTATTGLIETVAAMGCKTTVLYTGGIWEAADMTGWVSSYRRIGVDLAYLTPSDMHHLAGPVRERSVGVPWLVHEFVRGRRFDIVHFNDTLGEGMMVLTAKHLGLGFGETLLTLALHGPTRWAFGLNRQPMDRILYAAFDWAEQVSVGSADLLWGPSRYLIEATRRDGWAMPDRVLLQQYVMPTSELFEPDPQKIVRADLPAPVRTVASIEEIVFFGRLEERKGLRIFCAALDRVAGLLSQRGIAVSFMGRPMQEDGEGTDSWIRRAGAGWGFRWRIETGFGQNEAIAYLTSRPLVAVMPSPFDNSPCTVYEAIQHGIPFLAAATGGIPELIDEADHERVLFEYTVDGLAGALERVAAQGAVTAQPMTAASQRRLAWQEFHTEWRSLLPESTARHSHAEAGFLVFIDGAADAELVRRTLLSVADTLGQRVVRTVVLTRGDPGALPGDPTLFDPSRLERPQAVLAELIEGAGAAWVLCLSAGATLVSESMPSLDRALTSPRIGAGLIPAAIVRGPQGDRIVPPVGGAQAFGFFEGYGFTGAAVLSAEALGAVLSACEGLPRTAFAGMADLLAASGARLWPFPEVLVDLPQGWASAPVSFDPARDRAFAAVEKVQASLIRWIGAAGYRDAPASPERALALFLAGRPGAGPVMKLYRLLRCLRWALFQMRRKRRLADSPPGG